MALEAPASSPGADPRVDETVGEGWRTRRRCGRGRRRRRTRRPPRTVTRVVSPTISVRKRLGEIWRSRELLVYLVRTEIKVKYKNSFLGLVWSMIAPAMTLAIYILVFRILLKNGMPNFVIFLFAGLLLWNFFQTGSSPPPGWW